MQGYPNMMGNPMMGNQMMGNPMGMMGSPYNSPANMHPATPVGNMSPGIEVGRRVIDEPVTF